MAAVMPKDVPIAIRTESWDTWPCQRRMQLMGFGRTEAPNGLSDINCSNFCSMLRSRRSSVFGSGDAMVSVAGTVDVV